MDSVILSVADLRSIVTHVGLDALMDEVIDRLLKVCENYDPKNMEIATRDGFAGADGLTEWMPVMGEGRQATIKIVSYHPDNPKKRHLPTILSVAMTFDATTGHLIALSDATFSTALRTGAASAVASRILAIPDANILGLIGAGAQAVSQLHALSRVFEFEEVLVFDIDDCVSRSFSNRAEFLGIDGLNIRVVPVIEVVGKADIICTATSVGIGEGPVFTDTALQPHLHINAVGSDFPGKIELPKTVLKRSLVTVDFLPQAIKEGESQRLERHEIGPDLMQLVQGASQYEAHRTRPTVFDSTGFALEDDVAINILHSYARDLGYGTLCQIEAISIDPANPYSFIDTECDQLRQSNTS